MRQSLAARLAKHLRIVSDPVETESAEVSCLDAALALAAHNLYVMAVWPPAPVGCTCPDGETCKTPGKHPIGGQYTATLDADVIRGWRADVNIGIANEPSDLIAIDEDIYKGDDAKLAALESTLGKLPETLTSISGSRKGRHRYFRKPNHKIVGQLGGVTMRGLNITVAPPSLHESGGRYEWVPGRGPGEIEVAELPLEWSEALRRKENLGDIEIPDESAEPEWLAKVPQEKRVADMRAHLERELGEVHPAHAGLDTDPARVQPSLTFTVVTTAVRSYAVRDPEVVFEAVIELFNPKCVPPYEDSEIASKVRDAYEKSHKRWGEKYAPPPRDPMFDNLGKKRPTRMEIVAHFSSVVASKKTGKEHKLDAKCLAVVLSTDSASDMVVDQPVLVLIAEAMARHAPPGTTAEQLIEILTGTVKRVAADLLDQVDQAVRDAMAGLTAKRKARVAEATGEGVTDDDERASWTPKDALAMMNRRYAWIESLAVVAVTNSDTLAFRKVDGFRTSKNNKKVIENLGTPDEQAKGLGSWWLDHPKRCTYEAVGMWPHPRPVPPNALNLWRGFAVEAKPGDWSKMRAHIDDVIADGVPELSEYVIRWMAWTLQNPGLPAEVALVTRGAKGTGKGMLSIPLMRIFGIHSFAALRAKHVTGDFNAPMGKCAFLYLNEAFWAGDKAAEGALKGIITEDSIAIEAKGIDPIMMLNLLHIMISANADWVVPASIDERRYVVCDVSDVRRGDHKYFAELVAEMNNGGIEAMLHGLLKMDLGDWHPRQIVDSEGLRQQKMRSLEPAAEWTLALLKEGIMPRDLKGGREDRSFMSGGSKRPADWALSESLTIHAKDAVPRANWSHVKVADALSAIGAHPKFDKGRGWKFPTLDEARSNWCAKYLPYTWPADVTEWIADAN